MYPDAGSVLELHAFRTAHHVGRAEGMQLTSGDQHTIRNQGMKDPEIKGQNYST